MTISRRKCLSLIGGGTVLAATGATAIFLTTRTPSTALEPWIMAGQYPDARLRALSYALLAPNPHNRQPWVAELIGDNAISLYRDPNLNLPETDPYDRQLTIGMGCFIELMVQAAAQENIGVDLDLFPKGDGANAPIAIAQFKGGATPDPLFSQVLQRHTNRAGYSDKGVSTQKLLSLNGIGVNGVKIGSTTAPKQVSDLINLANEAIVLEAATPNTHAESIELTRIGKAEIEANPDGISLGGPLMGTLGLIGLLNRKAALDPNSSVFSAAIDAQTSAVSATPAFFWLTTVGNSRRDQIAAGRTWLRAHLQATALGLSVQPISQALQEYSEMDAHYRNVHTMLAPDGETVQMLGRLGYGPPQDPAPRWPLETRIKHAGHPKE